MADRSDFGLFQEVVQRVGLGLPMYGPIEDATRVWRGPNYNPPHFYLLFWPFGRLPVALGFWLWTVVSVAAGALQWRVVSRALHKQMHQQYFALAWSNAAFAAT